MSLDNELFYKIPDLATDVKRKRCRSFFGSGWKFGVSHLTAGMIAFGVGINITIAVDMNGTPFPAHENTITLVLPVGIVAAKGRSH